MSNIKINPAKRLHGTLTIPGDKSISHRAIMIGSIAEGLTEIKNFLTSLDCLHTLKAFQSLGVIIDSHGDSVIINGKGLGALKPPAEEIYLGNSGTSMRLISGILAGQPFQSTLTGDESLSQRPMDRVIKPLRMMGAQINGRQDRFPPLVIKGGKLNPIHYVNPVASAQVKSAIILAALYADGLTSVAEPVRSRDHTERMLKYFGAETSMNGLKVSIKGPAQLKAKSIEIPGDISSASFFIAAATLLEGSEITLPKILYNPTRLGLIEFLINMGADVQIKNIKKDGPEETCDITVRSKKLTAVEVGPSSVARLIDEIPILMVLACFAKGRTEIRGASELRVKETDRINSMVSNLKKMGAKISVSGDDITIFGTARLNSALLDSFGDHRTAMSMVVAGLLAEGGSVIENIDCIDTSFPGFFKSLDKLVER